MTEAEELQVLDLEANSVVDMEQVEFLQFVPSLQELTLRGNPIVDTSASFRDTAFALLPSLELLDDEPRDGAMPRPGDAEIDDVDFDADLAADAAFLGDLAGDLAAEGGASDGASGGAISVVGGAARSSPAVGVGSPAKLARAVGSSGCGGASPARPSSSSSQTSPRRPPATPAGSDIFGAADEAKRREEQLVSRGIKEAEVGRVYDVAADGRAMLVSASRMASRPSTARPLVNAWGAGSSTTGRSTAGSDGSGGTRPGSALSERRLGTAIGLSSRPGSSIASRPLSASSTARPMSALSRPLSSVSFGSSSRLSSGFSMGTGHLDSMDTASELTGSSEVICGVGKLRQHKLRRSVEALQRPPSGEAESDAPPAGGPVDAGAPSAAREPRPLEEELMDQLRAVKIQQLLAGGGEGDESGPSDDDDLAVGGGLMPVEEVSVGEADMLRLDNDDDDGAAARGEEGGGGGRGGAGAPSAVSLGYDEGEALDIGDGAPTVRGRMPAGGGKASSSRPSSSTDVTPTATPGLAAGAPGPIGPPRAPLPPRMSPEGRSPSGMRHGRLKEGGSAVPSSARMTKGGDGAPPVLRTLRMPDDKALADTAAEILQL